MGHVFLPKYHTRSAGTSSEQYTMLWKATFRTRANEMLVGPVGRQKDVKIRYGSNPKERTQRRHVLRPRKPPIKNIGQIDLTIFSGCIQCTYSCDFAFLVWSILRIIFATRGCCKIKIPVKGRVSNSYNLLDFKHFLNLPIATRI